MLGGRIANDSPREKPIDMYVGSTEGIIWMVMMVVALQWKAVPRHASSSSDIAAFVDFHRSSLLSDISAYIVGSTATPRMTEPARSSSLIMLGETARRGCVGAVARRPAAAGMNAADELMRDSMDERGHD